MKQLYFGDNLDILKKLHNQYPQGFIDLIYIDPPFNSKRNYNVLFESIDMTDVKAQKQAFSDTWSNVLYYDILNELPELNLTVYKFLTALDDIHLSKSAISYLTTMAIRLIYIHKVLKDTGSFYLHCDPNMSHYLKVLCDIIFKKENFRNEIIWCYKARHFSKKNFGNKHDIILRYSKTEHYLFNWKEILRPLSEVTIKKFKSSDEIGRYRLVGRGIKDSPIKSAKDVDPKWEIERPDLVKRDYLKSGVPFEDYWFIDLLNQSSKERLGYDTQKPLELLERIIKASSNEGDLVADFFCGCGTTIAAAEKLNRQWLGVDISHLAVRLILKRLTDPYPEEKRLEILSNIEISGFPKDIASAKELAEHTDKHRIKFQDWIVEVMLGGVSNEKKSGDGGIDGYFTFHKSLDIKLKGIGLIAVSSGRKPIDSLRAFFHVIEQNKADMGIFVEFKDKLTSGMYSQANQQGNISGFKINKIQIITVEDLLSGKKPSIPGMSELTHFEKSMEKLDKHDDSNKLF